MKAPKAVPGTASGWKEGAGGHYLQTSVPSARVLPLGIFTISNTTFRLPGGRNDVPAQACPSLTGWAIPVLCAPQVPLQQLLLSCSAGLPQRAAPQASIPQNPLGHPWESETTIPQRPLLVLFPLLHSTESSSRANTSTSTGTAPSFQLPGR